MSGPFDIGDIDLHAFIDGALEGERRERIAARIAQDPTLAARVASFRSDKEMLKGVYGTLADRPVPQAWIALAHKPPARPMLSVRLVGSIAAALLIGIFGTLSYQALEQRTPPAGIVEAALDARSSEHGASKVIEIGSGANSHNYDAVLSDAVKLPVKVPNMAKLGFQLVSIRFYQSASSAELLYRDRDKRLFTLYLRRSNGTTHFDQFKRDGLRVCFWQDDEVGAVMAGDISTAAMQRMASLAYTGLTL